MKILVLATNYTRPDGFVSSHYIHSRNKWYSKEGIDVTVLSFGSTNDYELEGVRVLTLDSYEKTYKYEQFDILLSHAPNLRNHYRFLKKYGSKFNSIVFFFHGHEVLECSKIYPKPYKYMDRQRLMSKLKRDIYDKFKLKVWKYYFKKIAHKSQFVFVSNWMYDMFLQCTKIDPEIIKDRKHIIYNCVGNIFEELNYDSKSKKEYDFITIRNALDGSKYSIDIVTKIAEYNPEYKFCVIGKGKFYNYNNKPNNIELIEDNLTHQQIIKFLNKSRCALIPTRTDAQGVMACEMATLGIPVITSNIDVCREVFSSFSNVGLIDNVQENIDIKSLLYNLESKINKQKNTKYFAENTIGKEIELFKKIL